MRGEETKAIIIRISWREAEVGDVPGVVRDVV